jgi:hypothetical protein
MRTTFWKVLSFVVLVGCGHVSTAFAQPIGTFRWQQLPYCNVLTLRVVQTDGVYQLDGLDDQCGIATQASVVGLAFPNPDGTIGIGLTIVTTPGGTPLHLDAAITLATVSGSWRDSTGNTGAFAFTPGAAASGAARPVPRAAFPAGLSAGGTTITNVAAPTAASDAVNKAYVDVATSNVRSAMLEDKVWSGRVSSLGTKAGPGRYSTLVLGTGRYQFTFDVTGLGIANLNFPNVSATASCPGGSVETIAGGHTSFLGIMTSFSASVAVTNAAGAAINCGVHVLAHLPDADTGSPIAPLDQGSDGPRMSCSTTGEVTTCVTTEQE